MKKHKMSVLFIFIIFGAVNILRAQNLIANGGFELIDTIQFPQKHTENYLNPKGWLSLSGTSDYYNTHQDKSTEITHEGATSLAQFNHLIPAKPHSGNACAGIYLYSEGNYREFITTKLKQTLIKGRVYKLSFYCKDYAAATEESERKYFGDYISSSIGVLFTAGQLANSAKFLGIKPSIVNDTANYIPKLNWAMISQYYTAKGGENYITIGNFSDYKESHLRKINDNSGLKVSYVLLDDINLEVQKSLKIAFNKNSSVIDKQSIASIKKIADLLRTSPLKKIEITGYTDSVGTKVDNFKMSYQRAESVKNYLIKYGVSNERIIINGRVKDGYIGSNTDEEGRTLNRRVEIIIK